MMNVSTIAAISTAPAVGAVSIIRLSGPESLNIVKRIFSPLDSAENWLPRQMRYGRINDPESGRLLDEVLAVWFPAPNSFTGEEVCEIQGHGGLAVTGLVLVAALKAGAELAQPGEFTRRAFMNGRLDLSQAEAVADLVAARSEAEIRLAARQLAGGLSGKVAEIHQVLFAALAELTADIDFGDDLEPLEMAAFMERLKAEALVPLELLLADGRAGRPFREGLRLALIGAPNVGKSSLFNRLVGSDRAMVSSVPGTTRDFITAAAAWSGLMVELCDTAGLSDAPRDELDALGQERSRAQLNQADLVLWVRDSSREEQDDEILGTEELPLGRTLVVWNKIDLIRPMKSPDQTRRGLPELAVSARTGEGLDHLKSAILKLATGRDDPTPPEVVPNLRHLTALARTAEILAETMTDLEAGQPPDICSLGLKSALDALEIICGRTAPEDILNEIFSRFCLGK